MPIYEYRCSQCGHELEALQKLSEAPLTACPACRASTLVKQVSAAGFQLKGSGWYATDFRGGNTAAKPAESAETKTDKPDAKPEARPAGDAPAETKSDIKSDTKSASAGCGTSCACH